MSNSQAVYRQLTLVFGDAKISEVYLSKKTKIATGVLVKTFHLPRNKINFYDED